MILREIERRGYTQRQLVDLLDEYLPSVGNLLQGKIAKVSVEKPPYNSTRLNIRVVLSAEARNQPSSIRRPVSSRTGRKTAAASV